VYDILRNLEGTEDEAEHEEHGHLGLDNHDEGVVDVGRVGHLLHHDVHGGEVGRRVKLEDDFSVDEVL
jgi:hypothetical protein